MTATLYTNDVIQSRGVNIAYLGKRPDNCTRMFLRCAEGFSARVRREGWPDDRTEAIPAGSIALAVGDEIVTSVGTTVRRVKRGSSARATFEIKAWETERISTVREGEQVAGRRPLA